MERRKFSRSHGASDRSKSRRIRGRRPRRSQLAPRLASKRPAARAPAVPIDQLPGSWPRESGPELPKRGPSTFHDGPNEIPPEISPEFRIGKEYIPAATPRKVASRLHAQVETLQTLSQPCLDRFSDGTPHTCRVP